MIFDISTRNLREMMKEANDAGIPHYLEQINPQRTDLSFTWQVDGSESSYGDVVVILHMDGSWSAQVARNTPLKS